MSNFPILDLVIGMIFIYFLLSIICSSAVELWFAFMKTRAKILEEWLMKIFDQPALKSDGTPLLSTVGQAIMDHCITTALSKKNKATTYIDSKNFVIALLDQITLQPASALLPPASPPSQGETQTPPKSLDGYIAAIENTKLISGELKRTILSFAYQAKSAATTLQTIPGTVNATIKSELDDFQERLEHWYDTTAERLTSAMKRKKAVPSTIIVAVVLAVVLNADSVSIAKYLYSHPEDSKALAEKAMQDHKTYNTKVDSIMKGLKITDTSATTLKILDDHEKN